MIQITATDFKSNLGKYLNLANNEEIHIRKNGREIAVLTAPTKQKSWVDDLKGIIKLEPDFDEKKFKEERLIKKYENIN